MFNESHSAVQFLPFDNFRLGYEDYTVYGYMQVFTEKEQKPQYWTAKYWVGRGKPHLPCSSPERLHSELVIDTVENGGTMRQEVKMES